MASIFNENMNIQAQEKVINYQFNEETSHVLKKKEKYFTIKNMLSGIGAKSII